MSKVIDTLASGPAVALRKTRRRSTPRRSRNSKARSGVESEGQLALLESADFTEGQEPSSNAVPRSSPTTDPIIRSTVGRDSTNIGGVGAQTDLDQPAERTGGWRVRALSVQGSTGC